MPRSNLLDFNGLSPSANLLGRGQHRLASQIGFDAAYLYSLHSPEWCEEHAVISAFTQLPVAVYGSFDVPPFSA